MHCSVCSSYGVVSNLPPALGCVCVHVCVFGVFGFVYKVQLIRRGCLPSARSIETEQKEQIYLCHKAAGLVLQAGEVKHSTHQCLTVNG